MPRPLSRQTLTARLSAHRALISVILAALLLRIALVPLYARLPNGYLDEGFWKFWMRNIHEHGVLNIFRTGYSDYVGYQWVLAALSMLFAAIGGDYTRDEPILHVLVKLPTLAFDVALIIAAYAATIALASLDESTAAAPSSPRETRVPVDKGRYRQTVSPQSLALVAAAIVAVHPAVVYDSAVWAQTDSAVTAAMLASIVLAWRGRPLLAWSVWTLGFLIKPHPIVVLPILVIVTARASGWRAFPRALGVAVAVAAIVLGPWIVHGDGVRVAQIYKSLFVADYARLSSNAWNLWWFWDLWAGHPWPEDAFIGPLPLVTYRMIGSLLSLAAAALASAYLWRRTDLYRALIGASYLAFAFYVVPVSTHDRYLYPFVALMLPVALVDRRWFWLYVPASLTLFLNIFFSAPPVTSWAGRWLESPLSLVCAAANVLMFAAFTAVLARDLVPDVSVRMRDARYEMPGRRRRIGLLTPSPQRSEPTD